MDAHIRTMLENTISNMKKAILLNDSKATWALLVNLQTNLPSYIEKAEHDAFHKNEETKYGKLRKAMK